MKALTMNLLFAAAVLICVIDSNAQSADKESSREQRGDKQGKGGQGRGGGEDVLFAILDANGDGLLSMKELQNAAVALRKLDKNGDGNLTQAELAPARGGKGGKDGDKRGKGDKQGQKKQRN